MMMMLPHVGGCTELDCTPWAHLQQRAYDRGTPLAQELALVDKVRFKALRSHDVLLRSLRISSKRRPSDL